MLKNKFQEWELEEEPFVSVLTPVYNGEKYLRECIESVLNQNYSNWEYVLVNNKSTDRSLKVMEEYAAQDNRIRIHDNTEHLSQMKNLNHAFRQISLESKYCKVVHADDWLFPDCISKMVAVNETYPGVGIVGAYRLSDKIIGLDGLPYPSNFVPGKDIARSYFLDDTFYFGAPTSLLIRTDLIVERDKVYVESHKGTDTGACLELLKKSDFGFVHQVLTYTRRHEESITNTMCRENFTFIHAKLYNTLEYGPFFLSDKEFKKCFSNDIKRYYVMLARNIFENKSIEIFKRQLQVLDDLGLTFKTAIFLKNFMREIVIQLFKSFGAELRKTTNNKIPRQITGSNSRKTDTNKELLQKGIPTESGINKKTHPDYNISNTK